MDEFRFQVGHVLKHKSLAITVEITNLYGDGYQYKYLAYPDDMRNNISFRRKYYVVQENLEHSFKLISNYNAIWQDLLGI